jgi:hypothetical protein
MSNDNQGNSKAVNTVVDSSSDFFDSLEQSVNGVVAQGLGKEV